MFWIFLILSYYQNEYDVNLFVYSTWNLTLIECLFYLLTLTSPGELICIRICNQQFLENYAHAFHKVKISITITKLHIHENCFKNEYPFQKDIH